MGLQAIVTGGVGSSGAAPGTAPAAPNVTSATDVVTYVLIGNTYYWNLSGTITLPSSRAAIAAIQIPIVGVDANAQTINAPTGLFGATVAYQTGNYPVPLASETLTVQFLTLSASGVATASPLTISITIAPTTISSVAIAEVGTRSLAASNNQANIQITPTLANTHGLQNVTFWFSHDGGANIYGVNWYPFYPGVTTSITIQAEVFTSAQSAGLTANNFLIYAVVGAQPNNPGTPISHSALVALYPSAVTSNAITILPNVPLSTTATATVTNPQGFAPTASNIYQGVNSDQKPYAAVYINLSEAGGADPNAYEYEIAVQWVDSSGTPIDPGGTGNVPGWQPFAYNVLNTGGEFQRQLLINYPAPGTGSNAYLQVGIWALSVNTIGSSGLQVAPFTSNPNATMQACWPGPSTFFSFQVGQPPATLTGAGLSNTISTANPNGVPSTTNQNVQTSLLQDWNFAFDALGNIGAGGPSQWAYTGAGGSIVIMNDGIGSSTSGIANYVRIHGQSQLYTNVIVPTQQALYFAFAARSNNPAVNIVVSGSQTGTASGTTNGTYTGVPLNGVGGTGATCTFTIVSNVITSLIITANGTGYTPNTTFTVSVTAAGGSGLQIQAATGAHFLYLLITAYDSNATTVLVNGNVTNSYTVAGSIPSWENTAASGYLMFPANVSYIHIVFTANGAEPATGYWDVSNVLIQSAQNQVASGQINSQYPQTQPTGVSAVATESLTTMQASYYGLAYLQLQGTASEAFNANINAGNYASWDLTADGGLVTVEASANNFPATGAALLIAVGSLQIQMSVDATGINLEFNGAAPAITINGHTGFTGAVAGRSAISGFVI